MTDKPNDLISQVKRARIDLESALQNSGVAISQQDLDLRYTQFVNTHPGMAQENLIGKTDYDWLGTEEADKLTVIKRRALAGKKGVREFFKSTLGNKKGDIFCNDIRVEPIWQDGKVIGIYTVAIDVTEFQNALTRLERLNGSLLKHMEALMGHKLDDESGLGKDSRPKKR